MADSSYEETDGGESFLSRTMDALVARFRSLVSKRAQKAYMGIFLFITTALSMIGVSTVAYFIFYYKLVPQVELERLVHLQFGDGHPWGAAPLGTELATLQAYDVTVKLDLPRTPSNLAAGNFMLDLSLFPHQSTSSADAIRERNSSTDLIARSRRPAILTYASPMVDTASKLAFMPLYLAGWRREAETVDVRMMEQIEFPRGWRNLPETLQLEIHSDERMQVYNAKVEFKATFSGLRWFVYNWRITSFVIFGFMFWCASMGSMSIVWLALAYLFSTVNVTPETKIKEEEAQDDVSIKQESEVESVGASKFPPARHGPLQTEAGLESEGDDRKSETSTASETEQAEGEDGTGTGLESAEARGVQRRRSRMFHEEDT